MSAKSIWITALDKDEAAAKELFDTARRYGLETGGHFWIDDLKNMAWAGAAPELLKPGAALWIIGGRLEQLRSPQCRFGLSMLALLLHARKGHGFPILVAPYDGGLSPDDLPTPLKGAEVVTKTQLGAKVAAKANMPMKNIQADYRLGLYPLPGLGLWFEVGPATGVWNGAIFGLAGGEDAAIDAHGVGPAGKLPERAVLEYPMQGLTLQAGEREYTAWAVKNQLGENDSYYLRVRGAPASLLFGELPEADDADMHVLEVR